METQTLDAGGGGFCSHEPEVKAEDKAAAADKTKKEPEA